MKVYISKINASIHGSVEAAAVAKLLKARKVEKKGNLYIATVDNKLVQLETCTKSNAMYCLMLEYTENRERKNKMLYLRKRDNERA